MVREWSNATIVTGWILEMNICFELMERRLSLRHHCVDCMGQGQEDGHCSLADPKSSSVPPLSIFSRKVFEGTISVLLFPLKLRMML